MRLCNLPGHLYGVPWLTAEMKIMTELENSTPTLLVK